jgi:heterotetrameric sarcosine oxidase gamma subunit
MSNNHSGSMLPTPLQQAGIEGTLFQSDTLELKEVTGITILRLHSLQPAEQVAAAFVSHGIELPLQPNHSTGSDQAALCLRPNEWLLFSEQSDPESLLDRLRPAIDLAQTSLLNNSDGLATFRLSGQGAPWLLSKLSGLDYLAGSSGAGAQRQHCARTRMAHAAVLVHYHRPDGQDSPFVFDLLFDRSFAKYLWDLLSASAAHADDLATTFG